MNTLIKCLIAVVALTPAAAIAESFLADQDIKYRGDAGAIRVCNTVVNDDPDGLRKLLKQHRREKIFRYKHDLTSRAIAGSFTCNGRQLLTFADDVGAQKVSGYLSGGTVTMEEMVSSTD